MLLKRGFKKMLIYKLVFIFFWFNLVLSEIIDIDRPIQIAGDVSISPSRYFLKKKIINPSIKPFLSEQAMLAKLRFTKSLIDLTTPKPTIDFNNFNESINQRIEKIDKLEKESDYVKSQYENYKYEISRTNNENSRVYDKLNKFDLNQDINNSLKNDNEIEHQLDVVTYSSLDTNWQDLKNYFDAVYNHRDKSDREIERIIKLNEMNKLRFRKNENSSSRTDRISENNKFNEIKQLNPTKPISNSINDINRTDYVNSIQPIKPINLPNKIIYENSINPINHIHPIIRNNQNRTYYRTEIIDLPDQKNADNNQYPIKFVEQYRCDLNVTTCGLYNDLQLRDMFYLEYIQDIYNKQRCFVADTSHARKSNQFGARLITQYFHVFGLGEACFELNYFANGPGIRKMEIAQQDSETKIIWTLNDYDIGAELNFNKIRKLKVPIKLGKTEPRFFITVNLDPHKIGTIGIIGFNFTYSKCDQI